MPGSKSSNKASRFTERKRLRNRSIRSEMKMHITKARKLTEQSGKSAEDEVVAAISRIDKAVSKGVIHRNKGARLKSQLMKKLNAVSYEQEAKQSQGSGG